MIHKDQAGLVYKRKNGFSLIELLAVIAIIGVLFALGVSQYNRITYRAKSTGVLTAFKHFNYAVGDVTRRCTYNNISDPAKFEIELNKTLDQPFHFENGVCEVRDPWTQNYYMYAVCNDETREVTYCFTASGEFSDHQEKIYLGDSIDVSTYTDQMCMVGTIYNGSLQMPNEALISAIQRYLHAKYIGKEASIISQGLYIPAGFSVDIKPYSGTGEFVTYYKDANGNNVKGNFKIEGGKTFAEQSWYNKVTNGWSDAIKAQYANIKMYNTYSFKGGDILPLDLVLDFGVHWGRQSYICAEVNTKSYTYRLGMYNDKNNGWSEPPDWKFVGWGCKATSEIETNFPPAPESSLAGIPLNSISSYCSNSNVVSVNDVPAVNGYSYAYAGSKNLKSLHLPIKATPTSMNNMARECPVLEEVIFDWQIDVPKTLAFDGTFEHCTSLKKVNLMPIPSRISGTFNNCKQLKEITLNGNISDVQPKVNSDKARILSNTGIRTIHCLDGDITIE